MHACIAALATSVPTIGLAYSYKFEGTFDNFNQKEKVINTVGLKKEDISRYMLRASAAGRFSAAPCSSYDYSMGPDMLPGPPGQAAQTGGPASPAQMIPA